MGDPIAEIFDTDYPEADEQYDLLVCHYSRGLIPRREAIILGPVVPQAPRSYLCHPLARDARKQSVQIFNEAEQNCNTCEHLQRVPFDRQVWKPSGLMPGRCLNPDRKPVYPLEGDGILFAPEDYMGQLCYEPRESNANP